MRYGQIMCSFNDKWVRCHMCYVLFATFIFTLALHPLPPSSRRASRRTKAFFCGKVLASLNKNTLVACTQTDQSTYRLIYSAIRNSLDCPNPLSMSIAIVFRPISKILFPVCLICRYFENVPISEKYFRNWLSL